MKSGSRSESSGLEGKECWGGSVLLVYVVWSMFLSNNRGSKGKKERRKRREENGRKPLSLFSVMIIVWP